MLCLLAFSLSLLLPAEFVPVPPPAHPSGPITSVLPAGVPTTVFLQPTIDFPTVGEIRALQIEFEGNTANVIAPMDDTGQKLQTAAIMRRGFDVVTVNAGARTIALVDVHVVSFDAGNQPSSGVGPTLHMTLRFSSSSLPSI